MKVSSQTLSRLQDVQADTMDDLCNVYRVSLSSGSYGNNVETRSLVASSVPCGIQFTNGQTKESGQVRIVDYDCILRVADGVTILMTDEIDLIEKGQFAISGTFKPFSAPTVNSSVQHVQLKRQTP